MAPIKAYAINTIKDGSTTVPASTKEFPSIFDIDDKKKFDALVKQNAVREATKDEIAIFKARQEAEGNADSDEEVVEDTSKSGTIKTPASGASGDPKGAPKGAAKTEDLGV